MLKEMPEVQVVDGTMASIEGIIVDRSEKLHLLQVAALLSGRDPERLEDNIRLLLAALENPDLWPPEPAGATQAITG